MNLFKEMDQFLRVIAEKLTIGLADVSEVLAA